MTSEALNDGTHISIQAFNLYHLLLTMKIENAAARTRFWVCVAVIVCRCVLLIWFFIIDRYSDPASHFCLCSGNKSLWSI